MQWASLLPEPLSKCAQVVGGSEILLRVPTDQEGVPASAVSSLRTASHLDEILGLGLEKPGALGEEEKEEHEGLVNRAMSFPSGELWSWP